MLKKHYTFTHTYYVIVSMPSDNIEYSSVTRCVFLNGYRNCIRIIIYKYKDLLK